MVKVKTRKRRVNAGKKSFKADSASLQKKLKHLNIVYDISRDVNVLIEMDECYEALVKKLCSVFNANIASLMLIDKKKNELVIEAASGLKAEIIKQARTKLGQGIAGWVAKELKPLLVKNINDFPQFRNKSYKSVTKYTTNSLLSVPLVIKNELVGVLNITDKRDKQRFSKDDLKLLVSIADHAAVSVRNSKQYKELIRLNEIKSKFISNLAHELKSPLATIKEGINLVRDGILGEVNDRQKQSLSVSIENIGRLVRMIDNLLDISKIESGNVRMKRELMDLNLLLKRAEESFVPLANKNSVNLKFVLPKAPMNIWADHDKIFEVMSNLLSNAIKYNISGGSVMVSVRDEDGEILISVKDTGRGMVSEEIPKIFERYGGLAFSKDGDIDSTGLGLSISKEIVELHRGRIEVESEPGKGSKFSVFLPKDLRSRR
ncbi:MAG: GAF domain-containing sensor histidine kinase [Candidatus Omnitrophica bacterium]|nr:GAF domain-containing sensor histidine kinase [Candidatus Omnitrophota bacterium]MDD5351710.1 GAF domain-containing sensor histidine kinase [Candidatus Omnitrophota bacterium]MDD5550920.1 GAF domain-containing sensor histidine kinase [Candidatus Omnitrophota bacterium]